MARTTGLAHESIENGRAVLRMIQQEIRTLDDNAHVPPVRRCAYPQTWHIECVCWQCQLDRERGVMRVRRNVICGK